MWNFNGLFGPSAGGQERADQRTRAVGNADGDRESTPLRRLWGQDCLLRAPNFAMSADRKRLARCEFFKDAKSGGQSHRLTHGWNDRLRLRWSRGEPGAANVASEMAVAACDPADFGPKLADPRHPLGPVAGKARRLKLRRVDVAPHVYPFGLFLLMPLDTELPADMADRVGPFSVGQEHSASHTARRGGQDVDQPSPHKLPARDSSEWLPVGNGGESTRPSARCRAATARWSRWMAYTHRPPRLTIFLPYGQTGSTPVSTSATSQCFLPHCVGRLSSWRRRYRTIIRCLDDLKCTGPYGTRLS